MLSCVDQSSILSWSWKISWSWTIIWSWNYLGLDKTSWSGKSTWYCSLLLQDALETLDGKYPKDTFNYFEDIIHFWSRCRYSVEEDTWSISLMLTLQESGWHMEKKMLARNIILFVCRKNLSWRKKLRFPGKQILSEKKILGEPSLLK